MISIKGHTPLRTTLLTVLLMLITSMGVVASTPHPSSSKKCVTRTEKCDTTLLAPEIEMGGGKQNWWRDNQTHDTRFRPQQLIAPTLLITAGALGVGDNAPLRGLSVKIHDELQEISGGKQYRFDDYLQYAPVALYLTLDFMGLKAKNSFGERTAVAAVTYIAGVAMTRITKHTVCEQRPGSSHKTSFPSGHTMTAFAGAELVRTEYGWVAGTCAYAVATTVGFMRMYNNRHWFNDVVAGAGFGILAARIGYWLLPLNRHIFKIPRKGQALIATPVYDSASGTLGLSCAMQF